MTPLSQSQPWVVLGMSRATWYRRGKPTTAAGREKPTLDAALRLVKAHGYRVAKLKAPKPKGRPGPVFACEFSDGSRVRMSVACSTEALDWTRGQRLARHAWASRHKMPLDWDSAKLAEMAPPISVCRFERDGVVLAQYEPHLDAFPPTGGSEKAPRQSQ